jgi:peptide/nickel transport system permease protein
MGRFIVRRIISTVLVLVAISMLTFAIFQVIPNGDPAQRLCGRLCTKENREAVRKTWGFDKSVPVQYGKTMEKIFTGKVVSYTQRINVVDEIKRRLPITLSLAIGAGILWLATGILFGLISALYAGGWVDRVLTVVALVGVSLPVFWLGAITLYFLAFKAHIFPNGGYVGLTDNPASWFSHMILPWIVLSVLFIGFYSRVLRSTVLDTMGEDYVRTARAKGLSERRVLIRHVVRNSLIPIFSLWGLDFAAIMGGGAILTESAFSLPGVGQFAAQSIGRLDIPPVLCVVMFGAFFVVVFGALVDVLYALLDPRIRLEG